MGKELGLELECDGG